MKNKAVIRTIAITFSILSLTFAGVQDTTPKLWVNRSISVDTIYFEGAPESTTTTVTLKAWASGDSIFQGQPIDVVILTDNSGSMSTRNPGTRDWIPPISRIQGTYNGAVNFVDSFMNVNDRVAHMRFCAMVDTPTAYTGNFPLTQAQMDTNINGKEMVRNVRWTGTAVWTGILKAVRYADARRRSGITPIVIALTDGEDNASGSYGSYWRTGMPNLGNRQNRAVDSVCKVLDSLNAALGTANSIKVFTINLGTTSNQTYMRQIAARGNGEWAYSATGTDLDSIFQGIGQKITDVAAISVSPGAPMFVDVLGPDIHYVPGSYRATTGNGFIRPSFTVDTVSGLTRIRIGVDTIRLEQFLEIRYDITAALRVPDILQPALMRTNNHPLDNASLYSYMQYMNTRDSLILRPIDKNWVFVKSLIGGLFLSMSAVTVVPPSPTGVVALPYTFLTPGRYPSATLHSLLKQIATDTVVYTTVPSAWTFLPNAGWIAPILSGVTAPSQTIAITVPYDFADQDTLRIDYFRNGRTWTDRVVFSAYDTSAASGLIAVVIDNDTLLPGYINPPTLTVTGNRTQLNALLMPLFARGITNRNENQPVSATWQALNFGPLAAHLNGIFNGLHTQRTLTLNLPPANYSRSDSGTIRIASAGLTFDLSLVIRDTTDYDTTDAVAIYDNAFGNNPAQIEAAYVTQSGRTVFTPALGDSVTLYSFLFDSNAAGVRYLSNAPVAWSLNGQLPVSASVLTFRGATALQTDQVIVSTVDEWGRVKRDTALIRWGFGRSRVLSLESQPGTAGSLERADIDSLVIPGTAADTLFGLYAVIRDEYGYCVAEGATGDYAVWSFDDDRALTYLSIPADSTSRGWIFKKSNPVATENWTLYATGHEGSAVPNRSDSIKIRLAQYAYDRIEIASAGYFQGFTPGEIVPAGTRIRLACDLAASFIAKARHDDSLYDLKVVTWSATNPALLEPGTLPAQSAQIRLLPVAAGAPDTLVAEFVTASGATLRDSLLFTVEPPRVTEVRLDTSRSLMTDVREIRLTGSVSQLRASTLHLYSKAAYDCPAMPWSLENGDWNTSVPDPWFASQVQKSATCSVTVNLSALPLKPGDKSFTGRIQLRNNTLFDEILLTIRDTTDYDTIEQMLADTAPYAGDPALLDYEAFFARKEGMSISAPAGDTLRFYPLFFDLNSPAAGRLTPKCLGTDRVRWELRRGRDNALLPAEGLSYALTGTAAGTTDTLRLVYPAQTRLLADSLTPLIQTLLRYTVVVNWRAGAAAMLRITASDLPSSPALSGAILGMASDLDTLRVFAQIYDAFGNFVSNADRELWSTPDAAYLALPPDTTHTGTVVKHADPTTVLTLKVRAMLPPGLYLGNGLYSPSAALSDSFFIRTGNFIFDSLLILSDNPLPLLTTAGREIPPGAEIRGGDTLVLRACDDTARVRARVHSTDSTLGVHGWIDQSVRWTLGASVQDGFTFSIAPSASPDRLTLAAAYRALVKHVNVRVAGETVTGLELLPYAPDGRFVLAADTAAFRTLTLTLSARVRTNCGRLADTAVEWTAYGFLRNGWQDSLLAQLTGAASASRTLRFNGIPHDTLPQDDSGFVAVSFKGRIDGRDTIFGAVTRLVLLDRTDYDTVDAVVIVPDTAYRNALNRNDLYLAYRSFPALSLSAGDTARLRMLLFDINGNGMKLLGSGAAPHNTARVFWSLNGSLFTASDPLFLRTRTEQGTDVIVAGYGADPQNLERFDTLLLTWGAGRGRFLSLELTPGSDTLAPSPADIIVMGIEKSRDTVFAVIRDQFGNFVSNAPLERWNMFPSNFYTMLSIPNPTQPTSQGTLQKLATPLLEARFGFVARLDRNLMIDGFPTVTLQRDTVPVVLVNYSFDSIHVAAGSAGIRDTLGRSFSPGTALPHDAVLSFTALSDTAALTALLRRNDDFTWGPQAVTWTVSAPSLFASAAFPQSPGVTLAPLSRTALDTLFALFTNGLTILRDTVLFTVAHPYIDTFIIVYDTRTVAAGDTVRFTIIALDRAGDTIRDPSRLPAGFTVSTDGTLLLLNPGETLFGADTAFQVRDSFTNGLSTNSLVTYEAGDNRVVVEVPYPGPGGATLYFRDTMRIRTVAGEPDSIVLIREPGGRIATADTLQPTGGDVTRTQVQYRVQIFDAYGNLLPDNHPAYGVLRVTVTGDALDSSRALKLGATRVIYNALGSRSGGTGILTVTWPGPGRSLSDSVSITVIPLVRIIRIASYEWVPDTVNDSLVRSVLWDVLGTDPDSLAQALYTSSRMPRERAYLDALSRAGFAPARDGYLDFLQITLSEPFAMTEDMIASIAFVPPSGGTRQGVEWRLSDGGRRIRLMPLDNPRAFKHSCYRLWLIPNSRGRGIHAPLETGFLPEVTFDNNAVWLANQGERFPVLLGNGDSLYTPPAETVVDSAAPVVSAFTLVNNSCNSENPNPVIRTTFSEPVLSSAIPAFAGLTALALVNDGRPDSAFMARWITDGGRVHPADPGLEGWNYGGEMGKTLVYEAVVRREFASFFRTGVSRIRFSGDAANGQMVDLAGNRACGGRNTEVALALALSGDGAICELMGTNVINREQAMNFSWTTTADGAQVPEFAFFGFTVNFDLLAQSGRMTQISPAFSVNGRNYVISDFDSNATFVKTEVQVFDLLGNPVADHRSHKVLRAEYTLKHIKQYLGIEIPGSVLNLTPAEIEEKFVIVPADTPSAPDTLRPRYPATLAVDYEYLVRTCGPEEGTPVCMPAWNCLNAKGRLVAPGGYVALQTIRTVDRVANMTRKLIVKSGVAKGHMF